LPTAGVPADPTAGVPADPTAEFPADLAAEVPADLAAEVPADLTASRAARHDITQAHAAPPLPRLTMPARRLRRVNSTCLGKPLFCLMLRGSDEL
jgi:hypothetical protein